MQLQTAGIDFDVTGSSLVAVPVTTDFMLADDPVAAASYAHQLRSFSSPQSIRLSILVDQETTTRQMHEAQQYSVN